MNDAEQQREIFELLAWVLCGYAFTHAVALSWLELANRVKVGSVEVLVRRRRREKAVLLVLLVLAAATSVLLPSDLPRLPLAIAFGLSIYSFAISPGFLDSWLGSRGVCVGFHARRFEELDEWRLIGDHLRWRLFGVWIASDVPKERHAALREKLERLAPDRESRFNQ